MRVLYVINGIGAGGAEQSLHEMVPRLSERDMEVEIVCLSTAGEGVAPRIADANLHLRFLPSDNWLDQVRQVRRLIAAEEPDVVHTTLFEANLVGRLAAAGHRVPVLTSLVNTSYDPIRLADPNVRAWKLHGVRMIDAISGRLMTDHYHAISRTVRDAAVRDLRLDPKRVTVVPRGRDEDRLGSPAADRRADVRERLGIRNGQTVLLNIGRQEFQKGQAHLLEALVRLRGELDDFVCLVAGRKGNATSELEATVAEHHLRDNVRFLGHREDAPDLLTAADLFVFPSLYEGLGGALIEAMALQVPIVASDIPAIREVTDSGRSATLVPPGDGAALARAIRDLLADPPRQARYRSAGRRIFERRYQLEGVVERMAMLYREVSATEEQPGARRSR